MKLFNIVILCLCIFVIQCSSDSGEISRNKNPKDINILVQSPSQEQKNIENEIRRKVDPVLWVDAESNQNLAVILYLITPEAKVSDDEIKKKYQPRIDKLSHDIDELRNQPRSPERGTGDDSNLSDTEITEQILKLQGQLDAVRDEMRRKIGRASTEASSETVNNVINYIKERGGSVTTQISTTSAIGAVIPTSLLEELAGHANVREIMKDHLTQYE